MENLKHSDHVLLCSTCQAKLSQAQEDEKRFNNFVEKLKKTNKKCIKSMPINKETCKIELNPKPKSLSLRPTGLANPVFDGTTTFNEVKDKIGDDAILKNKNRKRQGA